MLWRKYFKQLMLIKNIHFDVDWAFFSFIFFFTYIPADTLVISMVTHPCVKSELGIFVMERIAAR